MCKLTPVLKERLIHLAEAGYLLLVTSYWLLIRLLVTDSIY